LILDSSAVVAVLRRESGSEPLEGVLGEAGTLAIGAPTLFETTMVAIGRFGEDVGRLAVGRFCEDWEVEVVPFDSRHYRAAAAAFVRYGKGRHPARLNYGDCMTYAIARIARMPLLFIGKDFAKTDILPAL
jgi:ribonuclease VapC